LILAILAGFWTGAAGGAIFFYFCIIRPFDRQFNALTRRGNEEVAKIEALRKSMESAP
jgi:hypothetical protein